MTRAQLFNILNAVFSFVSALIVFNMDDDQHVSLIYPLIPSLMLIVFSQGVTNQIRSSINVSRFFIIIQILLILYILKVHYRPSALSTTFIMYVILLMTNCMGCIYLFLVKIR